MVSLDWVVIMAWEKRTKHCSLVAEWNHEHGLKSTTLVFGTRTLSTNLYLVPLYVVLCGGVVSNTNFLCLFSNGRRIALLFFKSCFCFLKKGSKMSRIQDITVLKTCLTLVDSLRRFPLCDLKECTIFMVWICDSTWA